MSSSATATGSRFTDSVIFGALVLIMAAASPRLLVYHRSMQVGTTRVVLAAVDSAGNRIALAPPPIQGLKVRATLQAIDSLAMTSHVRAVTPPKGHLEWTLQFTVQSGWVPRPGVRIITTPR